MDDPARGQGAPEEILAVFRRSRDEIERLVRDFVAEVPVAQPGL